MKWALISPDEISEDGMRVAQVCSEKFDVASPLYWVECDDDISAESHYYKDDAFIAKPVAAQATSQVIEIVPPESEGPPADVA